MKSERETIFYKQTNKQTKRMITKKKTNKNRAIPRNTVSVVREEGKTRTKRNTAEKWTELESLNVPVKTKPNNSVARVSARFLRVFAGEWESFVVSFRFFGKKNCECLCKIVLGEIQISELVKMAKTNKMWIENGKGRR